MSNNKRDGDYYWSEDAMNDMRLFAHSTRLPYARFIEDQKFEISRMLADIVKNIDICIPPYCLYDEARLESLIYWIGLAHKDPYNEASNRKRAIMSEANNRIIMDTEDEK